MAARQPQISGKPLKILQVASSLYDWGGIERYVVFLAQGLRDRGHDVQVACPVGSPISVRVPDSIPIEMRRKFDFRGFGDYLRLFRSQRFDIVHGHFSPDFSLPAYAAKLTRQPFRVMTRHLATHWNRTQVRSYCGLWDHIIPVSEAVENRLAAAGVPRKQMTVAKAGLPEPQPTRTRDEARRNLGIPDNAFAVGSFGRLVGEKGVEVLIDAIGSVPAGHAYVFGSGPLETELKLRTKGHNRVSFMGQIADVADAMLAMDVVAIPSTWEEPFPYAALEAMALGRPIVASRIGGLPEMVEDGVNGRLFTARNSAEMARALLAMKEDVGLGPAGRARYEREFTLPLMAERVEAVYLAR